MRGVLPRRVQARGWPGEPQGGFTLLEVLVALTILALAVVTLIQLSSQSLRLVKSSGDYQQAAQLADRIATESQPTDEAVDTGQEGLFRWERRTSLVPLPDELQPPQNIPGREPIKLFAVTVAVRWGQNQVLELATLHTPTTPPAIPPAASSVGGQSLGPGSQTIPPTQQPGSPGQVGAR